LSGKEAVVTVKRTKKVTEVTEADHKFIIAFCLIIGYAIALLIPIVLDKTETLKLVAATLSGPVGTVIGYYFGSKSK
jgi:hypothetical protein